MINHRQKVPHYQTECLTFNQFPRLTRYRQQYVAEHTKPIPHSNLQSFRQHSHRNKTSHKKQQKQRNVESQN